MKRLAAISGMATLLSVSLALLPTVNGEVITLGNKLLQVEFDEAGLTQIRDKETQRTIGVVGDHCVIQVDDLVLDSRAMNGNPKIDGHSVTYDYRSGAFGLKVVYELRPGWRFLSKQMFLEGRVGGEFTVKSVVPFDGEIRNPIHEAYRLNGERYGVSLRMKAKGSDASATHGCFLLVQNPYSRFTADGSRMSLSYDAEMKWRSTQGAFASDRFCIGTYEFTGITFRADMAPEWQYVQNPDRFLQEGVRIDTAEIAAVTDCARAFLLQGRKKSVRVHIGWCENDYQIDMATGKGRTEYRRIIDQAGAMGCQYVLYTPSHSTLAPLDDCRDAWKWESNLWFNMGQKIRKDEWIPGRDPLPDDIRDILDYAESKGVKLMAYSYPSMPFMQNPEWTDWLTRQGKKPGGYLTVDTGLRSFQDWFVDKCVTFSKATGCAGYSFDHWWIAYKKDLGDVSSQYQQWHGTRRVLESLRERAPELVVDGRQQYHHFGTWTWLAGTYPHPMMSDEQPGSFNSIVDLSTDRVNGARQRYVAWRLMTRDFCPVEILPGFITHQTQRSDADRVMRRDAYRTRDWDHLGWKYNLLSSVATAPFNHVVNYVPARDPQEFEAFGEEDKAFFRRWLDFTDENIEILRKVRPIIGQPMVGRCDGTSAILEDHGYVFLFNPNYRAMDAEFKLDASIGLTSVGTFFLHEIYPQEGMSIGKPGSGVWEGGDPVKIRMRGTSVRVLRIEPVTLPLQRPMLFGAPGKVTVKGATVTVAEVCGPVGERTELTIRLTNANLVKKLVINGVAMPFTQNDDVLTCSVTFAGTPFVQAQPIGFYDPDFNGSVVEGEFTIPKRIFRQLSARQKAWPVNYTEDDLIAPWTDPSRLLLYVQIAEPHLPQEVPARREGKEVMITKRRPIRKDRVTIEIDGKPVEVKEGYNGVYPYVERTAMGMYADISDLAPDVAHRIRVTLPEGLKPGQFQGLFFEHVETEFTGKVSR
jgi:hypothetical protein